MGDIDRLGLGMASVLADGDDATIDAVFTPDHLEEYPQGEIIRRTVRACRMAGAVGRGATRAPRREPIRRLRLSPSWAA